jgi:hypothetical protein
MLMAELDVDAAFQAGVRGYHYVDPATMLSYIVVCTEPPGS